MQYFYRHPELQKYRWYWRVEPDVHFHCDVNYDPFLFMEDHNKTYCACALLVPCVRFVLLFG